jgi:hypothetical protein
MTRRRARSADIFWLALKTKHVGGTQCKGDDMTSELHLAVTGEIFDIMDVRLTIGQIEVSVTIEILLPDESSAMPREDDGQSRMRMLVTDFGVEFVLGIVLGLVWKGDGWDALAPALVIGVLSALFGRRFWRILGPGNAPWPFEPKESSIQQDPAKDAPGNEEGVSG